MPTFYFSATASVSTSGGGTASVNKTTWWEYGEHWYNEDRSSTATFTAAPDETHYFSHWSSTDGGTSISTDNPYTATWTSNSTNESSPVNTTLYAVFLPKPVFYFSAEAIASPSAGGSASANLTASSVMGENGGTTSAQTTATFTATPNSGYGFSGWSTSENGTIESTNNPYTKTITSTSTDNSNPTNTTMYAIFTPFPTAIDADDVALGKGLSIAINTTLTPNNAYQNLAFASADPSIATVDENGVVTGVTTGSTTITIIARDNTNTETCRTTINVAVHGQVETPIISFDPADDGESASCSITCNTEGAVIHYTTDGSTPTPTSSQYSVPFSIDEDVVVKAIAIMSGEEASLWESSNVAIKQYVACSSATPSIIINGDEVTFSSFDDNVTFYYTTNGDTPTLSSNSWTSTSTAITGLTNETVIKVIAKSGECKPSSAVSRTYYTPSGVSDGVVTLNDLEDHNWAYYQTSENLPSGYPTSYLTSPDPRNVKITYSGGGVEGASAVAISGLDGEGQNTMIYYKTLEKHDLSVKDNGEYAYTVISNPFSKRPKKNSTYYGFAGWKVVSGAKYIQRATGKATPVNNSTVLDLDETIHFINLDNDYIPNCISAEVVFEATWTPAQVKTGTSVPSFDSEYNTYETRFWVINGDITGYNALSIGTACTMMAMDPDGETGNYNTYTIQRAITAGTDNVKIEWVQFNSTGAVDANGKNFTIGRGVIQNNNTAGPLYGINADANCNNTVKIESGKYSLLHNFNNGISNDKSVDQLMILGCDYDRAKDENDHLSITGEMYLGKSVNLHRTSGELFCRAVIKSGNFQPGVNAQGSEYTGVGGSHTYYMSVNGTAYPGRRYMLVEGGHHRGLNGGMDEASGQSATDRAFDLRVRGTAQIDGVIYGGAEFSNAKGTRTMIFTGGTINGWIAGGANGTKSTNGKLSGATYLYIGGETSVDSRHSTKVMNCSVGGNVYGAGCGYSDESSSGEVTLGTNIVVADNAFVERGVYGGGGFGFCNTGQTSNIYILGGHVGGYTGTDYGSTTIQGGVYGGARQNKGGSAYIYMSGGLVETGVYGGSNNSGKLSGSVTMQINGGQVGTSSSSANIHGGGYGQHTEVSKNVDITLGKMGAARNADGVVVYGDVYGGSALGSVNGTSETNTYITNVTMNAGCIHGSLYGGALGNSTTAANVYGPVAVKVYGGSVMKTDANGANGSGCVYGANNINGAPQRAVTVDIYGTNSAPEEGEYALFSVYGGGNAADYSHTYAQTNGYPKVTVHNCDNSIEYVYGGGNAAAVAATDVTIYGGNKIGNVFGGGNGQVTAANVTGNTSVKIYGGTIGDVYGGSNTNGTIGGTINVNVNAQAEPDKTACPVHIDNVYGGGNKAASAAGNITIGCAEHIGNVYGGANQANITGNINLNITSGHIDNVFGGNNTSGNITGNITVTVNDNNSTCGMEVGNVYGGGNKAAYGTGTNFPVVNIENGHLTGSVFGGGLGSTAVVTGNPQVTIGHTTGTVHIDGNVFGGGDAANVAGSPVVLVQNCNTTIGTTSTTGGVTTYTKGDVYGGGNAAHVTGFSNSTSVTINGGTINRVFGGGNGEVSAANVAGNANTTIHGGTIHQAFAGSNAAGTISGTATISVDKTGTCDEKIDELYGGGNLAEGNAGTVTVACGAIVDDVYGGANQAKVTSDITLNITGGTIKRVFGGNNTSGNITGAITVNIDKASTCESFSVENVYGAGNQASYTPSSVGSYPAVNIKNGTVTYDVFGGGLGSTATVTSNPVVTLMGGTVTGNIFGGGDAAPVTGNPTVVANYGSTTNIYAGGKGSTAIVTGSPTATINLTSGKTLSVADVFGGGDAAEVQAPTSGTSVCTVNMQAGTVSHIYGGGNQAGVSTTDVNVSGGAITDGLYGGCNTSGTVTGTIAVDVTGGTIGTSSDPANVHGGGFGANTKTNGDVTVNIGTNNEGTLSGTAVIYGDVYGGSALGEVNNETTDKTNVTLNLGTIHGDLYGGGLGRLADVEHSIEAVAANVAGSTVVTINDGTVNNVFGCNNFNGNPSGASVTVNGGTINNNVYGGGNLAAASVSPEVTINNGTLPGSVFGGGKGDASDVNHSIAAITGSPQVIIGSTSGAVAIKGNVFGGGDAANVIGSPIVTVNNCNTTIGTTSTTDGVTTYTNGTVYGGGNAAHVTGSSNSTSVVINGGTINRVFGGGNGEVSAANVEGDANTAIHAGKIHQAFAGSNAAGTISGDASISVDKTSACDEKIDELYGGGNEAAGKAGSVNIACGAIVDDVYGGANKANVNSDITLNVTGGTIKRVFGGNNTSGNVSGAITVNINKAADCSSFSVENVYGAGNQAAYTPTTVGAYPAVNIIKGTVSQNVYGGGLGSSAIVTSNPTVTINGGSVTGNVFGGGSAANVKGNTTVTLTTGTAGNLYGGGEAASVLANETTYLGNTSVSVNGGTVNNSIYGGGLGGTTTVAGNVEVSVSDGTITKDVYGGSGFGTVNTNENNTTTVTISGGTITQDVYGGGFGQIASGTNPAYEANVNGDVSVIINGGSMRCVFGCNNANGAPQEDVAVTVNGGTISANIYGGGNLAAASVSPVVTINNGTLPGSVFGGGLGASAIITGNPLVTIGNNDDEQLVIIRGNVFGGGDAANVAGKPKVVINDCNTVIGTYTEEDGTIVWDATDGTVYGGGNAADITGSGNGTDVTINGGKIHRAFGGGNGAGEGNPGANVAGNTLLTIKGGTVGEAFGGSNARGTIGGTPNVVIDDADGDCPLNLLDLYGGGNETPSKGGHLIVKGCEHIRNVYGGANNANITSDIEVTIESGYIQNVFGGNNNGGNITGSIIVNIDWDGSDCWNVDNVYGAGNLATYTAPTASSYGDKAGKFPEVNIKNGKVNYNVFGAGKGDGSKVGSTEVYKGQVTGNPQVKLTGGSCKNVYGGGDAAPVTGNTNVTINAASRPAEGEYHVEECVYGGGLGGTAVISGDTHITITGNSAIHGNVYGGGNAGEVKGSTHIDIK